jgi:hypothetical protein
LAQTQVMVYFTIFGDDFPLEVVTDKLGFSPTLSYTKGDLIPNRNSTIRYKETSWQWGTGYEDSYDVNEQIQQVIGQLAGKEEAIGKLLKRYSLECLFMIVIVIENGETPALYLNKDVIDFASRIGTEIHFDLYANPYERELD